jgi:ATP-dependent Lon protease
MITIPVYDMLLLPGVVFSFKKDAFDQENLEKLETGNELLFLMLKEDKEKNEVDAKDFYPIGIVGRVESVDSEENVRIKTLDRVDVTDLFITEGQISVHTEVRPQTEDISDKEEQKRFERLRTSMLRFVQGFQWGMWARSFILHWKNMNEAVCALAGYLNLPWEEKYKLLAVDSGKKRCDMIEQAIYEFMEMAKVSDEAQSVQKDTQEKAYRESAIKKQIQILQDQLDEMHPENVSDVRRFEKKIEESGMNEEAYREAMKILGRMKQEGKDSHEYGMLYEYLDFMTSLSWKKEEFLEVDLKEAEEILEEDHYGLKKVKERIIQQLAVMTLNRKQSGSILLFVGAPGTGKTSIGQSIAKALHREYVRISLGGVRDEAEIRGHRRTYVGAMPGRIMEGMKRSGVSNPVMVLDEVDKLSRDYSGDPASALLEVLDPEQNNNFTDHYMNVPYDLSNVLFVCTANTIDTIPEPLLNRMEVIQFPGYTAVEKFHIARKHLLPKTMESMGIKARNLKVTDDAIRKIIEEYTMESGVRGLKKQMDTLCRHAAVKLVKGTQKTITVSDRRLTDYLGRKARRHENLLEEKQPGIVTGLAWTQAGGEILFIETSLIPGKGNLYLTGQLGDVMKESAEIALSLVKSIYPEETKQLEEKDIHIHVPAGAVPKDGPSAGITLVSALSSLVTGKSVSPKIAMTGEISLRGRVMPIGGLPEKLMAAQRAGIETVLIPSENVEDLEDVAEEVTDSLRIIPVTQIFEVLDLVLQ